MTDKDAKSADEQTLPESGDAQGASQKKAPAGDKKGGADPLRQMVTLLDMPQTPVALSASEHQPSSGLDGPTIADIQLSSPALRSLQSGKLMSAEEAIFELSTLDDSMDSMGPDEDEMSAEEAEIEVRDRTEPTGHSVTVDGVVITEDPRPRGGPRLPRTEVLSSLGSEGISALEQTADDHQATIPLIRAVDPQVVPPPPTLEGEPPGPDEIRLTPEDQRAIMTTDQGFRPGQSPALKTFHEMAPVPASEEEGGELSLDRVAQRVVALSEPDGHFLTQYRILKRNLEQVLNHLNYRTIAITSAVAQEGRTSTALNLAVVMSENPWLKIAVVDLHLRRPSIGRRLGLPRTDPGLLEVLGGEIPLERVLRKLEHRNLYFLHAGEGCNISLPVINSPQFDVMLDHLKAIFDLIIIDAPPLLGEDDALVIHDKVDGMLMVMRAEFTELSALRRAIDRVGRDRLLGVILNDVRPEEVG